MAHCWRCSAASSASSSSSAAPGGSAAAAPAVALGGSSLSEGSPARLIIWSYTLIDSAEPTALASSTATSTGSMYADWPVSSKTMTAGETVCVTPLAIAAAPTTAYAPAVSPCPPPSPS